MYFLSQKVMAFGALELTKKGQNCKGRNFEKGLHIANSVPELRSVNRTLVIVESI